MAGTHPQGYSRQDVLPEISSIELEFDLILTGDRTMKKRYTEEQIIGFLGRLRQGLRSKAWGRSFPLQLAAYRRLVDKIYKSDFRI